MTVPNEADYLEITTILFEALKKYADRDALYDGAWKEAGYLDSLHHIRSKATRILKLSERAIDQADLVDDALDLINYTAFFIANVRAGRQGSAASGL
jgi:hypothetical protein